jgi:hypothetical protein
MNNPSHQLNARDRLERSMAACNLVARSCCLAVAAITARTDSSHVRRRWIPAIATSLFAAEAAAVAHRFVRNGTSHDEISAAMDISTSLFALVAEGYAHGQRQRPGGPRFGIDYAAGSLTFASSESPSPGRLAGSALAIGVAYWLLVEGPIAAKVNDLAIITSGVALQPILGQYRHQADELDAARRHALEQTEALAAERVRQQQRRVLHDSALQILEAVSGGWPIDDDLLLARLDVEIERLQNMLAGSSAESALGLAARLDALATEIQQHGFEVRLDTTTLACTSFTGSRVEALLGAAQEAAANVCRHSGATQVSLVASSTATCTTIVVADNGVGFDPSDAVRGFGINESICGRVQDVGGDASIVSAPEQGTRVTAWVPQ